MKRIEVTYRDCAICWIVSGWPVKRRAHSGVGHPFEQISQVPLR